MNLWLLVVIATGIVGLVLIGLSFRTADHSSTSSSDSGNTSRLVKLVSVALMCTVVGMLIFFSFFSWILRHDPFPWNLDQPLSTAELKEVIQSSVTLAAALGIGVTLFLSYRRQKTNEETQQTTAEVLNLQREQHENQVVTTLRDRYSKAAEQIASEDAAVRLAGVYALAGLADDWHRRDFSRDRQTCVSLLCAYYRMKSLELPDPSVPMKVSEMQVQDAVIESISNRMRSDTDPEGRWTSTKFDFRSATIRVARFAGCVFATNSWDFSRATLGGVYFTGCVFESDQFNFASAESGVWNVRFDQCVFKGGQIGLGLELSGDLWFQNCRFEGTDFDLSWLRLEGGNIVFIDCEFSSGSFDMSHSSLLKGQVNFNRCKFGPGVFLPHAELSGSGTTSKVVNSTFDDDAVRFADNFQLIEQPEVPSK